MDNSSEIKATISGKKNGALVFIGIVLLLIALILGVRVGNVIYYEASGAYGRAQRASAGLADTIGSPSYYYDTLESIEGEKKQAKIEALISVGTLLAGVVLLSLKSHFCSECGSKVGSTTAKLCGHCGARFKLG